MVYNKCIATSCRKENYVFVKLTAKMSISYSGMPGLALLIGSPEGTRKVPMLPTYIYINSSYIEYRHAKDAIGKK